MGYDLIFTIFLTRIEFSITFDFRSLIWFLNSYSVWINSNFLRDFSFSSTHFARKVGSDFSIFQKPNIPLAYAKSVSSSYVQSRIIVELKLFNYNLSYNYLHMRKNSLLSNFFVITRSFITYWIVAIGSLISNVISL